jgi:phage/plasmid-like protein (TIGR03299 family)
MLSNLLESAIANTSSGPVIVSENHDVTAINFVAGLSDPGEMIRCGAYQELRRLANEEDEAYAKRIQPLVMRLPKADRDIIMGAAIRRAGLDTSNGRVNVMVAGETPWHGLGVNVRDAVDSEHAIQLSGMSWRVSKKSLSYETDAGRHACNDAFAIVRDDTQACLGVVGSRYAPFQNSEGFKFLDSILDKFGAKYESCGSLFGGKSVWMLVHLPQQRFAVNGNDITEPYAIFTNSHDGKSAAMCFPTTVRTVCANTLRLAKSSRDHGLTIRHSGALSAKVESAKQALGIACEEISEYRDASVALAATKMPEPKQYWDACLDEVCDITAAQMLQGVDAITKAIAITEADRAAIAKEVERGIKARSEMLEDILTRYESEKNGVAGMRGTAYAAFQSLTESADHGKVGGRFTGDDNKRKSSRFESIMTGRADAIKQVAYEKVLEYAKA